MNKKNGIYIFLSVLLVLIAVSCSPAKEDSADSEFLNFNIKNYIDNTKYHDFSLSKIFNYTDNSTNMDLTYVSSIGLSISSEGYVSEFLISSQIDKKDERVNSSYKDGIFKIELIEEDQNSEIMFEPGILEDVDNLISSKSFEDLDINSIYLIGELSLDNIDYSYLSSHDLYIFSDNDLTKSAEDNIRTIENPIVFSALKDGADNPVYIIVKK